MEALRFLLLEVFDGPARASVEMLELLKCLVSVLRLLARSSSFDVLGIASICTLDSEVLGGSVRKPPGVRDALVDLAVLLRLLLMPSITLVVGNARYEPERRNSPAKQLLTKQTLPDKLSGIAHTLSSRKDQF